MESDSLNKPLVFITGAGPGDPELLTLKAKEAIEKSDVIAYDNLVSKEILELVLFLNPEVKLVYVGKVGGKHDKSLSQEQINDFILNLSKEYKTICRLKGGDPNIFGRGGEEALFLKENNISFEIIPGVSSINAVPAYAGIPLTHRDCNSSFTVITAHEDPENPDNTIKWDDFDAKRSTLVLLMGVKYLHQIVSKLINLGRAKDTPVAIIYWGTTSRQKTITTKLKDAIQDIEKNNIKAPSVIVIGKVANYKELLNWFEKKPLFGKRILITRSREQSFPFASKLIKQGAKPILCPIVNYEIYENEIYNKNIINNISSYDWIFFTSQNSVKYFFKILEKNCYDSRVLSKSQIAAVGQKTKIELEKYNIYPDFVPKMFSLEDLITELMEKTNLNEKKILLPTQVGLMHKPPIQSITKWGIYKANFVQTIEKEIIEQINEGIDIITFFSSNTAKHFAELIRKHSIDKQLKDSLIAVIGKETLKSTEELFGKVDIVAKTYTEEGLVSSLEKFYCEKRIKTNV